MVGHTVIDDVLTNNINESTSVTFVDILHKKKEFYTVNIKD